MRNFCSLSPICQNAAAYYLTLQEPPQGRLSKVVTSDEFLDLLIGKGCVFAWYFHYMPVGVNASTDLLLTPEQRA